MGHHHSKSQHQTSEQSKKRFFCFRDRKNRKMEDEIDQSLNADNETLATTNQIELLNMEDIRPEILQAIRGTTLLSLQKIKLLYYIFLGEIAELSPTGRIMPASFKKKFATLGSDQVVESVLNSIDYNKNGIDFIEFVTLFGAINREDIQEQKKLVFSIYDYQQKGVISLQTVQEIVAGLSQQVKQYAIDRIQFGRLSRSTSRTSFICTPKTRASSRFRRKRDRAKNKIKELFKHQSGPNISTLPGAPIIPVTVNPLLQSPVLNDYQQNNMLFSVIANFFGNDRELSLSEFENRANDTHEIYQGFGILTYFKNNVIGPIFRKIDADVLYPPRMEGSLSKRKARYVYKKHWRGFSRHYYVILLNGFCYFYHWKPITSDSKPVRTLYLVNSSASLINSRHKHPVYVFQIKATDNSHTSYFQVSSERERLNWIYSFTCNAQVLPDNRFNAFVPPTENNGARWFVDGSDVFGFIADAIELAQNEIFIAGWWVCPSIYLKRGPNDGLENRLDIALQRKAKEGVQIYVLIWNETKLALKLKSDYTLEQLQSLSDNIHVIHHPKAFPVSWAHHQKIVLIDQDIAVIGGVDLCYGRWDTSEHDIVDQSHLSLKWPGKDYFNEARYTFEKVDKPFADYVDRTKVPRMGWHDVGCAVDGLAARHVAKCYIQRWNQSVFDNQLSYSPLFPKTEPPHLLLSNRGVYDVNTGQNIETVIPDGPNPITNVPNSFSPSCQIQVLRSMSNWSGSAYKEHSIHTAYIDSIEKAEHFIYIETQFFISQPAEGVWNSIGQAIVDRVKRAIRENKLFRVIILMPQVPSGSPWTESKQIRFVMHWQFQTINRGENSMFSQLLSEFPDIRIEDYIYFCSLRNYGYILSTPVTEEVYVHSKMMIVDDRICLIGSANINDRSMCGDRDSEILLYIEDNETVEITFNNAPFRAKKFAHQLRMNNFREHLGLDRNDNTFVDPICEENWRCWIETSRANTRIYNQIFADIPRDDIKTFKQLKKNLKIGEKFRESFEGILYGNKLPELENIKGHLVEFVLHLFEDERLNPKNTVEHWLPSSVFQ